MAILLRLRSGPHIWKYLVLQNKGDGEPEIAAVKLLSPTLFDARRKSTAISNVQPL